MVVSTSFWSWLLNVSSVLISLKYTATVFWVVIALWVCWQFMGVLSFWFCSLCFWNMSFFVFVLDAIFCGTNFFIFQDSVWLVKKSWWVHCCFNHQFHWISDRCRSGFALWWFLSEENFVTNWLFPLASGLGYWMLLQFWHLWNRQRYFFGLLMCLGVLNVHGTSGFWILVFMFLNCVFFVFNLDAIFCGSIFFIFQDSVWLVKKSWWVHCCSNHQFYWVSDRCRSGFALWWFFVRRKMSSQIGSFH